MDETKNGDTSRHVQDTLRVVFVPLPDEGTYDLAITPREAFLFLVMSAAEYWKSPCDDLHCEVCYEFVTSWKSLYGALDADDRLAVEEALEDYDTRAPQFPQSLR